MKSAFGPSRHPTHAPGRRLLGQDRSRQLMIGAAVYDPERHFATANYRNAKGLLDHLVGDGEQRARNLQAQCLCGLDVEHEFELVGEHDR